MTRTAAEQQTLESTNSAVPLEQSTRIQAVILHHPDARRVGEAVELGVGEHVLNRLAPLFGPKARPLGVRYISRRPARLTVTPRGGLTLDPGQARVRLNARPLTQPVELSQDAMVDGVSLTLARRVVLWLNRRTVPVGPPVPGIIGRSDAIERLRHEVARVAAFDVPTLIVGETGSGKELVAHGIHHLSNRRGGEFVALNMATLTAAVAPAQLFGHEKGAFTGAERATNGVLVDADGGTVFFDEVGACPQAVQAQLLRALETRTVRPVGASRARPIDVRVVSATDAELQDGPLRAPLFHRLTGYVLRVPPLRARKGDIGLLLQHFLRRTLSESGQAERLIDSDEPWVPAELIERIIHHPWPGNVREVRNLAQTLAVRLVGLDKVPPTLLDDRLAPLEAPATGQPPRRVSQAAYRRPSDITEDELLEALRTHGFRMMPTARALGISRTALYTLIGLSDRVRTASSLESAEILAAFERLDSLPQVAQALEVSAHALKLRMRALGLPIPQSARWAKKP